MLDIIGVGDTNVDVMIRVPRIASHDEKVRGQLLGNFPGGIIGNFCCAAAAFGAKAGAVCKVGMDDYGELAKSDLQRRGVDISHMVVDPACETYFCMVLLDDTGEKALTIVETSGFLPKPEEVDLAYLKTAKRVHMTSLDMTLAAHVAQALDGTQTLLSMDIEATAGNAPAAVWDSVLQRVDTAFPNEAGLAALTGCTGLEAGARQLLARGVQTVVVTCGENGAWVFRKGYSHHCPAFSVPVQDTTGAGDCFNAVFLSGLVKGWSMERCAQYATAAAAIAIGAIGSRTKLPSRAETEQFILEKGEALCS